ncbi:MAG: glycosyltransferase [Marinosulfonomonas sp.]
MRRIVCIIGTDGSGKTTLSDVVVGRLNTDNQDAARVWLGAESYLMAPMRKLLKLVWKRQGKREKLPEKTKNGQVDYKAEVARKNALAARYSWAVRFYLWLVMADYRVQLLLKFLRNRRRNVIVADRYIFDVAVNIGLTLGWSPEKVVQFTQTQFSHVPLPQVRVFLRVDPEVSLSRKDDIPDINYLRLRFRYYAALAKAFGFVERDGTLPIADNADWLMGHAASELARPYVHYVHANNGDVGGADKVLALMAQHMRDHGRAPGSRSCGYRVAVSLRLRTPILAEYEAAGVPVFLHGFVRPQLSSGVLGLISVALRTPGTLWYFWRLFRREGPDIVHVNDLYDFLPAMAARLRGIPVVYHIRMIQTKPFLQRAFSWMVARLSQVSISVSEAVRRNYFPEPVEYHRAEVVYDLGNAILTADHGDVKLCSPRPEGIPTGGRLVVMVGRIENWKGQHVFVEAVRQLSKKLRHDTVFCLVGGSVPGKEDYLAKVVANAKALGVIHLGARDDVPAILRAADISVHCSTAPDPFPGVVIESMLAGAATVASDAGGVREMIDSGENGLRLQPGEPALLERALQELLEMQASPRSKFASAARHKALALVEASGVDAKISTLYRSLAPRAGAGILTSSANCGRK